MVPDKHRHLHRNQTNTNTYNNHQINDKNFATISHQTTEKLGLQVIKKIFHDIIPRFKDSLDKKDALSMSDIMQHYC